MEIICDCGQYLTREYTGKLLNIDLYSCTCGRKYCKSYWKVKEMSNAEYKRVSSKLIKL